MKISDRAMGIGASPIRKLVPYADEAKAQGKKIYHLNIGQPDVVTPENFLKAVHNFNAEVVAYSDSKGDPELIDSICKYYDKYGAGYKPEHVHITDGGSEAIFMAVQAVCDAGDEVLVIEPFYANYATFIKQGSARVVPVATRVENDYHLPELEEIEKKITSKTRAIVVTNPGNPTGAVLDEKERNTIISLVQKYDLALIADEVYREFCYDGEFVSFASYPEIEDNLVMIDSVSKRFSACGARIGCVISKNELFNQQIIKFCQARLCCPTLEMIAATELYKTPDEYFGRMKKEYQDRRDTICRELKKLPGVKFGVPHGAFYLMVKLPVDDAEKFAIWMLQHFDIDGETVMFAPGNGFYADPKNGRQEARLAYVINSRDIEKAIRILGEGLKVYPGKI